VIIPKYMISLLAVRMVSKSTPKEGYLVRIMTIIRKVINSVAMPETRTKNLKS